MNVQEENTSALIMCRPNLKSFFYFQSTGFFIDKFIAKIFSNKKPVCIGKLKSSYGDSYLIMLAYSTLQMKEKSLIERQKLSLEGLKTAQSLGVKKVSFAGLLPSLLNHFKELPAEYSNFTDIITKGHITTCLGIALLCEPIAKKSFCQSLAVVGLGSIGSLSLRFLLGGGLSPKEVILCDLRKRQKEITVLARQIQSQYKIPVQVSYYQEKSFLDVYKADLILGAVSSKSILSPYLLKKGAILVDDSFPPILSVKHSLDRMKKQKDVLILTAGKIDIGGFEFESHLNFSNWLLSFFIRQFKNYGLPGCWMEGLMSVEHPELFKKQQLNELQILSEIWNQKEELRLKAAPFHFINYKIPSFTERKVYQLRQALLK